MADQASVIRKQIYPLQRLHLCQEPGIPSCFDNEPMSVRHGCIARSIIAHAYRLTDDSAPTARLRLLGYKKLWFRTARSVSIALSTIILWYTILKPTTEKIHQSMAASNKHTSNLTSMFDQAGMRPFAGHTLPENAQDKFFFMPWDQYMSMPEEYLSSLSMFPDAGNIGAHHDDTGLIADMLQSYAEVSCTPAAEPNSTQGVQSVSDLSLPLDTEGPPKKDVVMVLQAAGNKEACLSNSQKLEPNGDRECGARRQVATNDTLLELSLGETDQLIDKATSPEEKQALQKQKRRTQNKLNAEIEWAGLERKIGALLTRQSELEEQVLLLERQTSMLSLQNDILMQENTGLVVRYASQSGQMQITCHVSTKGAIKKEPESRNWVESVKRHIFWNLYFMADWAVIDAPNATMNATAVVQLGSGLTANSVIQHSTLHSELAAVNPDSFGRRNHFRNHAENDLCHSGCSVVWRLCLIFSLSSTKRQLVSSIHFISYAQSTPHEATSSFLESLAVFKDEEPPGKVLM
ncbi:uncharacterized protein BDR25DRAFT_358606 [Lindgomyces ingoldianus]|uniref:Uncharacterized protein n=1 Tax=Lindgomyces ingoldianus TaxID=673940 RepID=A0ACB6QKE7_9PLEO|nr:uncharacterized protein BDR25DRAFT_358606 [Lindgomyces ingoldianus]KAF2467489.1 hypothetical protein BDR25DRAFT_358606 [Lindgomyces ingoldianus]